MKKCGTSCIIVCSCMRGYSLSFTIVQTCMLRGRKTIIMVIIMLWWPSRKTIIVFIIMLRRSGRKTIIMFNLMLPWRLLLLTGVRHKELSGYACLTRKVAQRCANWLVSPYSDVWAMCKVYVTHPSYPLGEYHKKIDGYDRSRHCVCMFLHLTPIVGSLTGYFF